MRLAHAVRGLEVMLAHQSAYRVVGTVNLTSRGQNEAS